MEPEPAGDSGAGENAPLVFVSDASAEAERLTLALRARGYTVADVPLALLPGRVAVQRPLLVLCDADAEGAVDALLRIRDVAPDGAVAVVLAGDRDGTIARIDVALVDAVFARPVNVQELVSTVERLVGVVPAVNKPASLPPSARGWKIGSSSRPPGRHPSRSVRPEKTEGATSAASGLGAAAKVPLPPDLAGDGPTPREAASDAPVVELSADIQLLLLAAERRLGDGRTAAASSGGEEPGPEVETDAPVPPDVLLALEEALDEDDEPEKTGVPERAADGEGSQAGAKTGHHTQGGGTSSGTGAAGFGTDTGAPIPDSRLAGTSDAPGSIHGPRDSEPADSIADSDGGSRRARQQASTPRPPKPGLEDLIPTAPPQPHDRSIPAPPLTAVEHAIPDPPSKRKIWEEELPDLRAPGREGTETHSGTQERALGGDRLSRASEPVDRPDLTSTTPPLRLRDERRTDAPPGEALLVRESDRPSSPGSARLMDDRPPPPFAENDARGREAFAFPAVLRLGDAVVTLASAIRTRFTGAIAFEVDEGIRRVVLRDGDFVTAASGVHGEALVAFLANRGDLPLEVARQAHKLPAFGRRAGAALIAHGHLAQDQLWPVLRAHAEWIIGRIVGIERGGASQEDLGRLHDEPAVFGGATGAEVLVEVVRRIIPPDDAVERLGGPEVILGRGAAIVLLGECALSVMDTERVHEAPNATVRSVLEESQDPSLASALYALVTLGVLSAAVPKPRPADSPASEIVPDDIDEEAARVRILSRKALVDDGDYFSVLGVARNATGYDIRRAYTTLRREFEPSRVLTAKTSDLGDVVEEIVEVLEEAYEILSDQRRRDRYRRAIEATP